MKELNELELLEVSGGEDKASYYEDALYEFGVWLGRVAYRVKEDFTNQPLGPMTQDVQSKGKGSNWEDMVEIP
ncbi:hypothetical protein [Oceanirhabdus sp. W0125-5]|uniref:hypothetical protein n=1 Tax=Oceanirhabdus sp. W0125-5 TaxID=2999116 RepID=UPI0022F303FA|nr:hypothetical protein [Oceanirhabdus sp. W0125-5]WBW97677.1 hypothetical protein OW730_02545 [Oceanirhabdus sp. W0125-5]